MPKKQKRKKTVPSRKKRAPLKSLSLDVPIGALELHRFASKDREHIAALQIEQRDDRLYAVATDGHRLALYSWQSEQQVNLEQPLLLDPVRIATAIKSVPKKQRELPWTLEIRESLLVLTHLSSSWQVQAPKTEAGFPDWRHLMPNETGWTPTENPWGFNAQYIADFGKYLKDIGWAVNPHLEKAPPAIKVVAQPGKDGLGPILFEPVVNPLPVWEGVVKVQYLLMPIRID